MSGFQPPPSTLLLCKKLGVLGCGLTLFFSSMLGASELSKQDKLKAAYLFNFSKYVSWPQTAFADQQSPIRVCLQASAEFVAFSKALTANRKVGSSQRSLLILEGRNNQDCHLQYLSEDAHSITPFSSKTLVVASNESIKAPHAGIRFYLQGAKLRFEVDLEKTKQLDLILSSELLKLAKIK